MCMTRITTRVIGRRVSSTSSATMFGWKTMFAANRTATSLRFRACADREGQMIPALTLNARLQMGFAGAAVAMLVGGAALSFALAQEAAKQSGGVSIRNLSPNGTAGWVPDRPTGDDFLAPPSGPGPVMSPK